MEVEVEMMQQQAKEQRRLTANPRGQKNREGILSWKFQRGHNFYPPEQWDSVCFNCWYFITAATKWIHPSLCGLLFWSAELWGEPALGTFFMSSERSGEKQKYLWFLGWADLPGLSTIRLLGVWCSVSPSPFELWFLLFPGKNILFSQVGTACSSKGYIPLKREASWPNGLKRQQKQVWGITILSFLIRTSCKSSMGWCAMSSASLPISSLLPGICAGPH